MNITSHGNPTQIERVCEWTGKTFIVDWKHRNQRFIDKHAMYEWRKTQNREQAKCLTCGNSFERYKIAKHWRTGTKPSYCSTKCLAASPVRRQAAKEWTIKNQPMNNPDSREKIRQSKLTRHGNPTYNNIRKHRKTMMNRYGVACPFFLPTCKSNGRRISKFQRKHYEKILKQFPDAELEKYLKDVQKAVDIFIPSTKQIIECHGDYWHCNPVKYLPEYYNKLVHLTAKEIWKRDCEKKNLLELAGYSVEVIWENA